MRRSSNYLTAIGLGIGVIFGMTGSILQNPQLQIAFYEISSVGLTMACLLLGIKYLNEKMELVSAGFFLLAIGEAVMSSGTALGEIEGQASFGAGIAIYVPAFLLISIPRHYPLVVRILGIIGAIPFLIGSIKIFMGEEMLSSSSLIGAGYGLFSLTIIGWIIHLVRSTHLKEMGDEKLSFNLQK